MKAILNVSVPLLLRFKSVSKPFQIPFIDRTLIGTKGRTNKIKIQVTVFLSKAKSEEAIKLKSKTAKAIVLIIINHLGIFLSIGNMIVPLLENKPV